MTEQEIAELVKEHERFAEAHVAGSHDAMIDFHLRTAKALSSLQVSLALCERRAEEAESRVTFYESELVKTAMALAKITDELRALREAGK